MKQFNLKYCLVLLIGLVGMTMPFQASAYVSTTSGSWTDAATWGGNGYPVSGDIANVQAGHTVTYNGNLTWTAGQIEVQNGATLIIKGDLNLTNTALYMYGGTLIVEGNLIKNSNLSSNGSLYVTGSVSITGDLNATGLLSVDGDVTVTNQLKAESNAVIDIDGNASAKYLFFDSNSLAVIDKNLTITSQLGSGSGKIVVGGDYVATASTSTYLSQNQMYVFGTNNCTNGNCSYILDETDWLSSGTPGSSYISSPSSDPSTPSWWEDHLANANATVGSPTTVCNSTTFSLEAVTTGAGDMSTNTFEWAVYGGTISANTGGTQISANSGTVDDYTASVLSYYGIDAQTTYTITVTWTDNNFSGAYVAVRQSSASGCSDGKWSVFPVSTSRNLAITCPGAATATCFASLPVVNTLELFTAFGGSWTDTCNDPSTLSISTNDVISTASGCSVTRTYTITDGTASVSCTQQFNLTDASDPTLTCSPDIETNPNAGCIAVLSISAPTADDDCSFTDPEPSYYYYPGNNTSLTKVEGQGNISSASFPLGTTTIYWSITDDCGHTGTCNQIVTISFPITYDGGQTQESNGPGMNPVQTSTHNYTAFDNETDRTGYTYNWQLFDSSNNEITNGFNVTTNGNYSVSIQFGTTTTAIAPGSYVLRVTKTNTANGCSISGSLPIKVITNDFNISVEGEEICQSGETGTTELKWVVTLASANAVPPFALTYRIIDSQTGSVACGEVSVTGISFADSGSYAGSSSCSSLGINPATKQLYISYPVTNTKGVDHAYQLELTSQTDAFLVSDPVLTNNNAAGTAHGIPATSYISTN